MAGALLSSSMPLASTASAKTPMQEYVEAMQPGTNWGNTLDASPNRYSWGAPETTEAMIQGLVAKGYKSLRLPVTWVNYLGSAPDYTIDPAFMAHVKQVVDWALAADLYVMINMHHDSYWLQNLEPDAIDKYLAVWTQVADQFKDYPDKLSFESINEPGFVGMDDAAMAAKLHEINTAFHTLVRSSGGGNATRPLVIPSVYTRSDQPMLDALKATILSLNDPNLIGTIHYYGWYPFSVNLGGYTKFDDTSIEWVHTPLDAAYDTLVADGIPVIVGEFSVLSGSWIQRGEQLKYHEYVQAYGRSKGMTMMLWDTGGIYDRNTADWRNRDLGEIMMQAVVGRAITAESDMLFIDAAAPVGDAVVDMHLNGNTLVGVEDNGTMLSPMTDYTVSGDTLTLKAHVLAKYAMGAWGEKATLKLHADSGPAWKIFVRYAATPVPGALTTTTKVAFSLPVAFNGDLLATMESTHEDGSNVGPTNWTSFQPFGGDFRPNYSNNTIEFTANFFADTPPGIVNLDLHFWSGKVLSYQLQIVERSSAPGTEYLLYSEGLTPGWNDWTSWTAHNLDDTTQAYSGSKSLSITMGTWGGVSLQRNSWEPAIDTSAFRTLSFWIHGGTTGGQKIGLGPIRGGTWGPGSIAVPAPLANEWMKVEIPLSSLGVDGSADITGFFFQDWSGGNQPTFYLDDILLTTAQTTAVMDIYGASAPIITSTTTASGMVGSPFSYTITAIKEPVSFSAAGLPLGLAIDADTGVISGNPLEAGWHFVVLGATNASGTNTEVLELYIAPAPVEFSLPGGGSFSAALVAPYDGGLHPFEVETNPPGIPVLVTYNGSTDVPTLPGTYHVVITSADPNYAGSVEGTLVVTVTALVRHAPALNGDLDGSLQLLSGESFTVNGGGMVSGDLLLPGTPAVQLNGTPTFAGIVDASGAIAPSNYGVTLNGGSVVRFVTRRVDPIEMPVVTAPAQPTGTRSVTLNNASQNPGDFATIRNLTLNGNAGTVVVPSGVYGSFTVNGNGGLVLGVEGAEEPAVYELQGLTLNGNASVQVVGPVVLKLANGMNVNGVLGSAENPEWLELQIANGGLTVNGNGAVNGVVIAPKGSVMINGRIHGRVSADRLTINGNGVLEDPEL